MKKIKGYILYIDLLGYKNLLRNNSEKENERIKRILEEFTEIYTSLDFRCIFGEEFDESRVLKRYFSDNFIFVYKSEKEDFMVLKRMQTLASHIQNQFINCGLLVRGSLLYGEIEYSAEIVFGVDLIRAVELENHAEPSILIDKELKSIFDENGCEFHEHNDLFSVKETSEADRKEIVDGINKCIENLNRTNIADQKIYDKIAWLIDKTNEYFCSIKNRRRLRVISSIKLIDEAEEKDEG